MNEVDQAAALVMERARAYARAAIRPATLAAEFGVSKDEIVEAIAKALLPFVDRAFRGGRRGKEGDR